MKRVVFLCFFFALSIMSILSSDDWICQNGNVPLNYLYDRHMHYNISTSQLN